jgi:hypothetical protein
MMINNVFGVGAVPAALAFHAAHAAAKHSVAAATDASVGIT